MTAATVRTYCPSRYCEETSPPGRSTPTDWLAGAIGDRWAIAPEDEGEEPGEWTIAPGDVVDFMWLEERGSVEVTIAPDGSFTAHGRVPDANHFWLPFDPDTMMDSLEEFCRCWADNGSHSENEKLEVYAYTWSEDIPYRLVVEIGGARFEPVDPAMGA